MTELTEHFTLAKMTKTSVNLKNVPSEAQVANLKRLCGWLERLRSRYNERARSHQEDLDSASDGSPPSTTPASCDSRTTWHAYWLRTSSELSRKCSGSNKSKDEDNLIKDDG